MQWPVSEIETWAEFFSKEPPPDDRLEMAIAQGIAIYVNGNQKTGSKPHPISDFLLFHDVWKSDAVPEPAPEKAAPFSALVAAFGKVKKGR